jgi:hypothetical protein
MVVNICQDREGGTMNRKSGALGLLWVNGKQDMLVIAGILAVIVSLLALALAVIAIVGVLPFADFEVSPGIMAGFEVGLARWSVLGELYAADNEGSSRGGITQAMEPDEAFVPNVALTDQSSIGHMVAGPCSALLGALSMGPIEAEAYAQSLVQAGQGAADLVGGQ